MNGLDGDAPPPDPDDAHGNRPKRFKIAVMFGPAGGGTPPTGSYQATVSWT